MNRVLLSGQCAYPSFYLHKPIIVVLGRPPITFSLSSGPCRGTHPWQLLSNNRSNSKKPFVLSLGKKPKYHAFTTFSTPISGRTGLRQVPHAHIDTSSQDFFRPSIAGRKGPRIPKGPTARTQLLILALCYLYSEGHHLGESWLEGPESMTSGWANVGSPRPLDILKHAVRPGEGFDGHKVFAVFFEGGMRVGLGKGQFFFSYIHGGRWLCYLRD